MNIDDLIPTDGSVLILSARMLNGKVLWAKTEVSSQLWKDGPLAQVGQLLISDLRHAEQLAMERGAP